MLKSDHKRLTSASLNHKIFTNYLNDSSILGSENVSILCTSWLLISKIRSSCLDLWFRYYFILKSSLHNFCTVNQKAYFHQAVEVNDCAVLVPVWVLPIRTANISCNYMISRYLLATGKFDLEINSKSNLYWLYELKSRRSTLPFHIMKFTSI